MSELCERSVINVTNGENMGNVDDIAFNAQNAQITHVIIYGRLKWFGLMGRAEDIYIPWEDIEKVGKDVLLVNTIDITTHNSLPVEKQGFSQRLFG